jgi:hypothetical protein
VLLVERSANAPGGQVRSEEVDEDELPMAGGGDADSPVADPR